MFKMLKPEFTTELCFDVGRDETVIREYIRNQEREDERLDQVNSLDIFLVA